jgi:hypothetical protein
MTALKNSQRISYKATYNQISPTATSSSNTTSSLQRAVEKTAFIQSLRIVPQELASLKKQLSGDAKVPTDLVKIVPMALNAISKLINDQTASATLNNANLFAKIPPAALTLIAGALITLRGSIADSITSAIADIFAAYRSANTAPTPPTSAPTRGTPKPVKGSGAQSGQTDSGVPITTTTTTLKSPTASGKKSTVKTGGYTLVVAVDDSKAAPSAFSSVISTTGLGNYKPSNAAAIAWAERYQPKLFGALVSKLQPYIGVSTEQFAAAGASQTVLTGLKGLFNSTLNLNGLSGTIAGFQSRMTVEPVGNLHLERVEMYPAGVERGELIYSVPLAPGETVNLSHKEWSTTEKEFEDIVNDYFEGYSEQGVAEKSDIAMSNDSQSQHSTALNVGASLSASYSSVTLSTSFGYNATSNDSQSKKDSRNHSIDITKKASSRTKKDHKVTFKVTSVTGSEDQSVRIISNPSPTDTMRIDYFQLARKWKVDLLRYGLRMTYDIVIPNPGSGIVTLVDEVNTLDAEINTPFTFNLPLSAIKYNPLATDPSAISNYDQLAAKYNAVVTAPPDVRKWVNVHKETAEVTDYDHAHFDSVEFDIDDGYYISQFQFEFRYQMDSGETNEYFLMIGGESLQDGLTRLIGESGHLSIDFMYQYIYNYAINITIGCRPKPQVVTDWRLQAWNQIRQAAEDDYNKGLQNLKDRQAQLVQKIADYDALTLRRMEQEEIMKGVLRWLLGPEFYLVPFDLSSLFGQDSNDPEVTNVLDPNQLTDAEWIDVMEHGEFIKYIHNAIEWENVLYFTYPYFWDDNTLWDFKKFLYHPDPTHRTFLRSGAARVVLTIRPGFEPSFTSLIESGAFNALPGAHPYVTIAQEIQDFANTNYPGFPPANPEQDARPLLYLEQRRVWTEMQYIIQLLNASKAATGSFPLDGGTNAVPAAALTPFLNGPIVINGVTYNGVNDYNTQSNTQQLALDPNTPQEALLPTYTSAPVKDLVWNNPYFYKCPGDTGDYDLISYGADGVAGGTDKNEDISANSEASLISTWFEYTPTGAMDIAVTTNPPNTLPPQPDPSIA